MNKVFKKIFYKDCWARFPFVCQVQILGINRFIYFLCKKVSKKKKKTFQPESLKSNLGE